VFQGCGNGRLLAWLAEPGCLYPRSCLSLTTSTLAALLSLFKRSTQSPAGALSKADVGRALFCCCLCVRTARAQPPHSSHQVAAALLDRGGAVHSSEYTAARKAAARSCCVGAALQPFQSSQQEPASVAVATAHPGAHCCTGPPTTVGCFSCQASLGLKRSTTVTGTATVVAP